MLHVVIVQVAALPDNFYHLYSSMFLRHPKMPSITICPLHIQQGSQTGTLNHRYALFGLHHILHFFSHQQLKIRSFYPKISNSSFPREKNGMSSNTRLVVVWQQSAGPKQEVGLQIGYMVQFVTDPPPWPISLIWVCSFALKSNWTGESVVISDHKIPEGKSQIYFSCFEWGQMKEVHLGNQWMT